VTLPVANKKTHPPRFDCAGTPMMIAWQLMTAHQGLEPHGSLKSPRILAMQRLATKCFKKVKTQPLAAAF
jgi:hypothetical protein